MKKYIIIFFILIFPLASFAQFENYDFTTTTANKIVEDLFKPVQKLFASTATSNLRIPTMEFINFGAQFNLFPISVLKESDLFASLPDEVKAGNLSFKTLPVPLAYFGLNIEVIPDFLHITGLVRGFFLPSGTISKNENLIVFGFGGGVQLDLVHLADNLITISVQPLIAYHFAKGLPYTESLNTLTLNGIGLVIFDFVPKFIKLEGYANLGFNMTTMKTTKLPVFNKQFDINTDWNATLSFGADLKLFVVNLGVEVVVSPKVSWGLSVGMGF